MNSRLEEAFRWLTQQQERMTSDLMEVVRMNSGSDNLPGLLRVADWLESWADLPGTEFRRVAMPSRQVVTNDGRLQDSETGPLLRWDFRPQSSYRVLLAIHYDTVFGVEHSFQECQMIDDDRLQGPGAADAKGGIVVLRNALQAAHRYELLGDIGFSVVLNPDEEVGSLSSSEYLRSIASEFQIGLLFEPALPTGELVSARKGSGNFDIVVRGKAAHAGRHFSDGRNAIALLSRIFVELDQLNGKINGLTVNLGGVSGGGPVNVVPDLAIGRLNIRVPDEEANQWLEEQLQQILTKAKSQAGFQVELYGGITSPPKPFDEATKGVANLVETASSRVQEFLGEPSTPIQWKTTGGVCDGNKLAAAGLPNIDTLGPIGDGLHSDQEWVQVSSLSRKAQVIAALLSQVACNRDSTDAGAA